MKKKILISALATTIFLATGTTKGNCAQVPIPTQGSTNQTWDNFSINNNIIHNTEQKSVPAQEQPAINTKDSTAKELPQYTPVIQQMSIQIPAPEQKQTIQKEEIKTIEQPPKAEVKKVIEEENTQTNSKNTTITPDKADALTDIRNQAKLLYNANKSVEAQKLFAKIPDSEKISDDWLYLANIAQDDGKDLDAVFYLKKAIQADPNNHKAHYNLGNIYLMDEKINMAIDEYNRAIKAKKDFSFAYYNKGCAYLKKNNYFNAKYEFGLAIKYNPNEPSFYYNLAYTYKMMGKEKKAYETLKFYQQLMQQ